MDAKNPAPAPTIAVILQTPDGARSLTTKQLTPKQARTIARGDVLRVTWTRGGGKGEPPRQGIVKTYQSEGRARLGEGGPEVPLYREIA